MSDTEQEMPATDLDDESATPHARSQNGIVSSPNGWWLRRRRRVWISSALMGC
jgi:hypothetical protein